MKNTLFLIFLLFSYFTYSQNIDPFALRFQANQKGGLVMLANASIGCNCAANNQTPPGGNGDNNGNTMSFIDIDSDPTTFMSSSDQLNLPACSEITWAGLYWSGQLNNTPATTPNWATRGQVRLSVDGSTYTTLTADELLDNTVGKVSYFGFKNITAIAQANGINSIYRVANVVGSTGLNVYGGWTIVVVYGNIYQSMRNITVFDGLTNVSAGASGTVNIPLSGFLTPPSGPVNFELGVVAHDGDRAQTGDQLAFNGAGTFVSISDAIHPVNNVFNSTISNGGVLTPLRNPSYNNTLGHDANIYKPNNTTFNYIGNSATNATIRVSTTSETVLTSVITSAIDIFEPDLRASVSYTDLNGGTVVPGDFLEYKIVAKNIGSDVSIGTILTDTLDPRLEYQPGTIQITYGPNAGSKTDPIDIDQAEFLTATNTLRARIGTGANGSVGGAVVNSPTGADSTVIKFQVKLNEDCLVWQCGPTLANQAFLFGTGQISGIFNGNNGASDLLDINGCPTLESGIVTVDVSNCADTVITHNDSLCVGEDLWLNFPNSPLLNYSWTGPDGFTSTINNPEVLDVELVNGGDYVLSVTLNGVQCITDSIATIFVSSNPTLQLNTLQNDSCFNSNLGFINVSGVGNSPFTYVWSNGDTDSLANDIGEGTYSVIALDQYGCDVADTFSLTEPTALNSSATITSDYNGQDISCFGAMDGSAQVTANGGTLPYTFLWTPNLETTAAITGLDTGKYVVTVTDLNGCKSLDSLFLTQPDSIVIAAIITDVLCFGNSTGAINATITGGTTPYSYDWSNGAVTQDLSAVPAGTYSDTVTDVNGCSASAAFNIIQPPAPLSMTDSITPILCFGDTSGNIALTVAGGVTPYTYVWSNGDLDNVAENLGIGTYTVTVTDSNNCTISETFTLTQPALLIGDASITSNYNGQDISCFGAMDGSAGVTVSGGVLPYTYLWLPGLETVDSISNLDIGTYTVTVTDANGCFVVDSVTLTQPDSLAVSAIITNVLCFGDSTGAIDVSVVGGTTPYAYSWTNGILTQDLSGIPAGIYVDTVTDINGCFEIVEYQITQPSAPLSMTDSITPILCFGDTTGNIALTVVGGVTPYTYVWSNGDTDNVAENLGIGTYTVTVTDSNNCTISETFTLTQPTLLIGDASITSNYNGQDISCFGAMDGSADVTVSGGVLPYTYLWSPGLETVDSISNLDIGTYSVTVTDANGCFVVDSVTLTQPDSLAVSAIITNVLCFGDSTGAIDVSVVGGTTPYVYSWNNGILTQDLSGIPAGIYVDTVTDINGCFEIVEYQITQPSAPLSMTDSITPILCFDDTTGNIALTVVGGVTPYTYVWSNGDTDNIAENLGIGTYTVTVTDSNNCTISDTFTLTQPTLLTGDANITSNYNGQDISCFGAMDGSADVTVSGGVLPYTYLWSPGLESVDSISNLDIGTYTVTVTDANGCFVVDSVTLTQPDSLIVSAIITNVLCFGDSTGAIDVSVVGGTTPYVYSWTNGILTQDLSGIPAGIYVDTVTDINGCFEIVEYQITQPSAPLSMTDSITPILCFGDTTGNIALTVAGGVVPYTYVWSNGDTDNVAENLGIGTYTVTVTDSNNCTISETFTLTQPTLLTGDANITSNYNGQDISCFGAMDGSADVTVSGGVLPYTYLWLPGLETVDSISNLDIGTYTVTVTDANGCFVVDSVTLTQPDSLIITATTVDVLCFSYATGSIDATVQGGILPYSYSWSNGANTEDLSALIAGNYSDTVTDLNGCVSISTFTINQPADSMTITGTATEILCFGDVTSAIDLTVTGGIAPYTYLWSTVETTQDIDSLGAGTYSVQVTDSNNCVQFYSITITQPDLLSLTATHLNPVCANGTQGSIDLTLTGGTPSFTYVWNNGGFTQDISDLFAGDYFVSVTDTNGCMDTLSVTLTDPDAIFIDETVTNVLCYSDSTGSIDISVSNGTPLYSFDWSNGAITEDLTNIPTGSYYVNVSDVNSCGGFMSFFISQPDTLVYVSGSSSTNVLCFNDSIGTINIEIAGGVAPYTYAWDNGQLTQDIQDLGAGIYTVIVLDSNLCQVTFTDTIFQPTDLVLTETHANVLCFGDSTASIDLTVVGGVEPYSFAWNSGQITEDLSNIPLGTYVVTVTDSNNCVDSLSIEITQPLAPLELSLSQENVLCFAGNSGSIDLTVTGGTSDYTYLWNTGDTIQDLDALTLGNYDVVVTDANGCSDTISTVITQPTAPISLSSTNTPTCFGAALGSIDLSVTGGTGSYSYLWNNTEVTQDLTDLAPGIYTVTVTDANLCEATLSDTIIQPTEVVLTETHENVLCYGDATGSINVSVTGGVPQYTYAWDNGTSNQDLANIPIGTYTLIVVDSDNCPDTISVQITQPNAPLNISSTTTDVFCNGGSDGTISATVSGGTTGYSYSWDSGQTTEDLSGVSAGTYVLTVTDANGCVEIETAVINEPNGIDLTMNVINTCFGKSDGAVSVVAAGGNPGYTYLWNTDDDGTSISELSVGTYTVTVTDANGCSNTASVNVTILGPEDGCVVIDMPNVFTPNGDGVNEIFLPIELLGVKDYQLVIVNRWGNVVYEGTDPVLGWDGRTQTGEDATDGVYFWRVNYTDVYNNASKVHGNVTIVRD